MILRSSLCLWFVVFTHCWIVSATDTDTGTTTVDYTDDWPQDQHQHNYQYPTSLRSIAALHHRRQAEPQPEQQSRDANNSNNSNNSSSNDTQLPATALLLAFRASDVHGMHPVLHFDLDLDLSLAPTQQRQRQLSLLCVLHLPALWYANPLDIKQVRQFSSLAL